MTRQGAGPSLGAAIRTAIALVVLATRRLRNNPTQSLITLLGLSLTAGVITSAPLYAEGMSTRLLRDHLPASLRPLDAGLVVEHGPQTPDGPTTTPSEYLRADQALAQTIETRLGLSSNSIVRFVHSDIRRMLFMSDDPTDPVREDAPWGRLASITALAPNVEMLGGQLPATTMSRVALSSGQQAPLVEAIASTDMLDATGLVVGDRVQMLFGASKPTGARPITVVIDIVGRFAPHEIVQQFWPYDVDGVTKRTLFISPDVFIDGLLAAYPDVPYPRLLDRAVWFVPLEVGSLQAGSAGRTREGIATVRTTAERMLPNTSLHTRLEHHLEQFEDRIVVLTVSLMALSLPIIVMVIGFMRLSGALAIEQQRQEIALLRSRGLGLFQLGSVYLAEWLLIGLPALVAGLALGVGFAQAIGQSAGFLVFDARPPLAITLHPIHVGFGAAAITISLAATLGPVISAARLSIVGAKQQMSGRPEQPLYQRRLLDVLLVAIALIGFFLLRSIDTLPGDTNDYLRLADTLLVLAPMLFIFAVSVFALRAFPFAAQSLAAITSRVSSVSGFVALRQIGRNPAHYTSLVLLLSLTFALGTFSASLAATIDRNIVDRVYFATGADARIIESGHFDPTRKSWYIAPVDRHLDVVGKDGHPVVVNAARIWTKNALLYVNTPSIRALREVRLHAVDPVPFAQTVTWREDFAPTPLNALANALAADDRGVILEYGLFHETLGVQIGDPVTMEVDRVVLPFVVVGWMEALPAHNRGAGPFAVTNLTYISNVIGRSPWDTIARLAPNVKAQELIEPLNNLEIRALRVVDARAKIAEARSGAVLIGTFGLLTLAFAVAAALTVIGFTMHVILSLRRRVHEFGILRAMGISARQMATIVSLEQGFLVLLGTAAGTAVGLVTATLFIPFLQLSAGERDAFPPFIIHTAWGDVAKIYVVFAVLILLVLPLSIWLLRRVRTYEAITFGGETG